MIAPPPLQNNAVPQGSKPSEAGHWLRVQLVHEADGRVSALAADLPGLGSQGKDRTEALERLGEAAAGVLRSYRTAGQPIPWERDDEAEFDEEDSILVHA